MPLLKVVICQSISLKLLHKLVVDVLVQVEVLLQIFLLERVLEVLQPMLVDWVILTSSGTTPSSSNSDKSSNKTLRCLSLSYNKLVQAIHSWHS